MPHFSYGDASQILMWLCDLAITFTKSEIYLMEKIIKGTLLTPTCDYNLIIDQSNSEQQLYSDKTIIIS